MNTEWNKASNLNLTSCLCVDFSMMFLPELLEILSVDIALVPANQPECKDIKLAVQKVILIKSE